MTIVNVTPESFALSPVTPVIHAAVLIQPPPLEIELTELDPVSSIPLTFVATPVVLPLALPALSGPTGHNIGGAGNNVSIETVLGSFFQTYVINDPTQVSIVTSVSFVLNRAAGRSLEDRVAVLGYRPVTPVFVYAVDVQAESDVALLLHEDSFLVSNVFVEDPTDLFFQAGARRAYVGTKVIPQVGSPYFIFRAPELEEVVWHAHRTGSQVFVDGALIANAEDRKLYRYYADTAVWREYASQPERSVEGQYAASVLDPDRIIAYVGRILGATLGSGMYDVRKLYDAFDARRCPDVFIPYLGSQFGQPIDLSQPEDTVREAIIAALPLCRLRGQEDSAYLALRGAGLRGYCRAVWVDPRRPPANDTWTDPSAAPGLINPLDSDEGAGPPATPVHYDASGALTIPIATVLSQRGIYPRPATGWKGWDWFEAPHGYFAHDPSSAPAWLANFWPTALVVVHVNNADGTPLDMNASVSVIAEIREQASKAVLESSLPVHARVRLVATDYPVAGAGEALGVNDTMTITQI